MGIHPRWIGTVAVAVALLGAVPATVSAVPTGPQWGWVVVREAAPATGSTYTPASEDQGNSSSGINTVTRVSTGRYRISFAGLGTPLGIAHVSMFRTSQRTCSIDQPFVDGSFVRLFVNCYDLTPAANFADATFILSYLSAEGQQVGNADMAYVYADSDGPPLVSYNSAGRTNGVERLDFGDFRVTLRGMAGGKGHLQVSPWARGVVCSATGWRDAGSNRVVRVRCLSIAGVGQDVRFYLTFMRGIGLKGAGGERVAYLLADRPTAAAYTARADSSSFSSADKLARMTRQGVGRYQVKLPRMGRGGAAHVTTLDAQRKRCVIRDIERDALPQVVAVKCMTLAGTPADAKFYLTYLG